MGELLRKFKKEDLGRIVEIEEQAFPKTSYPKEVFLQYAKYLSNGFVVIEVANAIVGYIIFDQKGHIHSTAVEPKYRRQGFGKQLMTYASEAIGRRKMWLEVRTKNRDAISFYESLGMRIVGKIPEYYGNDDAFVMVSLNNT